MFFKRVFASIKLLAKPQTRTAGLLAEGEAGQKMTRWKVTVGVEVDSLWCWSLRSLQVRAGLEGNSGGWSGARPLARPAGQARARLPPSLLPALPGRPPGQPRRGSGSLAPQGASEGRGEGRPPPQPRRPERTPSAGGSGAGPAGLLRALCRRLARLGSPASPRPAAPEPRLRTPAPPHPRGAGRGDDAHLRAMPLSGSARRNFRREGVLKL